MAGEVVYLDRCDVYNRAEETNARMLKVQVSGEGERVGDGVFEAVKGGLGKGADGGFEGSLAHLGFGGGGLQGSEDLAPWLLVFIERVIDGA